MAKRVFRAGHPEPPADIVALYDARKPGWYLVRTVDGGWRWSTSAQVDKGTGGSWEAQAASATDILVEMAVTGTATPDDQGELTTGLGDQTQTPAALSQRPQGTTNAPSPVSGDHEAISSRVSSGARDELILAIAHGSSERNLGPRPWECGQCERAERIADRLLAAGWRPPLPADEVEWQWGVKPKPEPVPPPPPLSSDPGDWKFRGYDQMGLPAWSWAPVEPKETP